MEAIDDTFVLGFGKHKGKMLKDVPADYHLYMFKMDIYFGELKDWVKANKEALEERAEREK